MRRIQLLCFKHQYWMRLVFACTFIHGIRFTSPAVINILPFQGSIIALRFCIVEMIK